MIGIPIDEASLAIAIDMSPTILVAPATIGPGKSVIDLCFYGSSLLDRALALVARSSLFQMTWQTIEKTFQTQTWVV